jgi:hypothetical protein
MILEKTDCLEKRIGQGREKVVGNLVGKDVGSAEMALRALHLPPPGVDFCSRRKILVWFWAAATKCNYNWTI